MTPPPGPPPPGARRASAVAGFLEFVRAEVALDESLGLDFVLVELQRVILDVGHARGVCDLAVDERTRLGGHAVGAADDCRLELVGVGRGMVERARDIRARRRAGRTFAGARGTPFATLLCTFAVTSHGCAPALASLPMAGVLSTPTAVLAQPDAIGVVALALIRLVVTVLALLAGEGDSNPNVSAGHVLSLRKRFAFRVWTKKNPAQTRGNGQFSALASSRRYGDAMPGNEPPSRRARARRRGRAATRLAQANPAAARRRSSAALGAIALLLFVLLDSAGSHRQARSPSAAASRDGARPRSTPARAPGARTVAGEPAEVRRLIALGKPIYCAAPRGGEVALTFDDGPGPYTRLMIDKLRKHGVHATFFIVGRNIPLVTGPGGASIVREERTIAAVGDHTFTHPLLTSLAPAQAEDEIVKTQHALARASGAPVFLFRPPYGAHDAQIDAIARAHGLLQILWTVDSRDSLGANYAQIERTVISGLHPGAIVLMHENHGQTIRAMLSIFAALAAPAPARRERAAAAARRPAEPRAGARRRQCLRRSRCAERRLKRGHERAQMSVRRSTGAAKPWLLVQRQRAEDHVKRDERPALELGRLAVAGDLRERERRQQQRADVNGRERERQRRLQRERDQHEQREEERRDLRDGVLHDGDREVRAALPRERDAGRVLDGVAGDRDDHEPCERLREVQFFDRRRQRVDEPVRDERRCGAAGEQQREDQPQRKPRAARCALRRARVGA